MPENEKHPSKTQNPAPEHRRSIRSFVKRGGRLTTGQRHALDTLWTDYGMEYDPAKTLDFSTIFPGKERIKLEIGFGNGDSLVEMAASDPDAGYVGIEVHEPGVGHCLQQAELRGVRNLKLMSHDAIEILQQMIPPQSLEGVFLFFPDPWHKKKHHKRRIVNQQFRDLLSRLLKPGGIIHMATDWQDYAEHMLMEMSEDRRFSNLSGEGAYSEKPAYRPETKFERRGQRLGHGVWDLLFSLESDLLET